MTAALVGAMWGLWIVLVRRRPGPDVRARFGESRSTAERPSDLVGTIGAAMFRVLRRPATPLRARQLGTAVVLAGATALAFPLALPIAAATGWVVPKLHARAVERRRMAAYAFELAEVVDLLSLAVGAGLTVALAVEVVGRRAPGALAAELRRVGDEVVRGSRLADALEQLPDRCGDAVRPLVAALVSSERYGSPLAAGLDRLALEVRRDRRRQSDEAVRRVPVKLLFPLITCTLPAFALLTVAPLLASAVRSLRL